MQALLWVFKESNFVLRIFSPPQCNHTCPTPIRLICVSPHITFHKSRTKISIEVGVKGLEPIVFLMCQIYSLVLIHHLSSTPINYYPLQHQRNYIPIGIVPVGVKALDLNALLEYTLIPILIKEIIFFISFIIWS